MPVTPSRTNYTTRSINLSFPGFNEYCALIDGITADLQKEGAFVDNNIFIDKILNREIIQDTYINFIESPEISEAIKEYNKLTLYQKY